jgi:hypothetical protein
LNQRLAKLLYEALRVSIEIDKTKGVAEKGFQRSLVKTLVRRIGACFMTESNGSTCETLAVEEGIGIQTGALDSEIETVTMAEDSMQNDSIARVLRRGDLVRIIGT